MFFVAFLACGDSNSETPKSTDTSTEVSVEPSTEPSDSMDRNTMYTLVSEAICSKISTCCDESSTDLYFAAFRERTDLQDIVSQLPPSTPFSVETCKNYMPNILDKIWLGSWMNLYENDLVAYNPEGFEGCLNELNTANCGEEVREALFDSQCFGLSAPDGGEKQRRMFDRTAQVGATCQPLADGFGGLYYGSCDPTTTFCCVYDETLDGCDPYPVPENQGTCLTASQAGESCSTLPPLQICATGLECSYTTGICEAPLSEPLQIGASCYDSSSFTIIGDCQDSWCDLLGSGICEPLNAENEICQWNESCSSGYCDSQLGLCSENPICAQ